MYYEYIITFVSLNRIRSLIEKGQFEDAYSHIKLFNHDSFEMKVLETFTLEGLNETEHALELANELCLKASNEIEKFQSLVAKTNAEFRLGNYDAATILCEELQNFNIENNSEDIHYWLVQANRTMGLHYHVIGNLNKALVYHKKTNALIQQGRMSNCSNSLLNLGEIYMDLEELDLAYDYFTRALNVSRTEVNDLIQAYSNYNLAKILRLQGQINHALEHCLDSLEIFVHIQRISGKILALNELGLIKIGFGQLDDARNLFYQGIELCEEMDSNYYNAILLQNLSMLEIQNKNVNRGLELHDQAIKIWSEIGNKNEMMKSYFDTLVELIEIGFEATIINKYNSEFKELIKDSSLKGSIVKKKYLDALILKGTNRLQERALALKSFNELRSMEIKDYKISVGILLNLLELKLFELKTFEDELIKEEMLEIILEITNLAEKEGLIPLNLEILLLRAKLGLILQDFDEVKMYINRAFFLSKELENDFLTERFIQIREVILSEISKWKILVSNYPKLKDQIDQIKIIDYLKDVSKVIRDTSYNE